LFFALGDHFGCEVDADAVDASLREVDDQFTGAAAEVERVPASRQIVPNAQHRAVALGDDVDFRGLAFGFLAPLRGESAEKTERLALLVGHGGSREKSSDGRTAVSTRPAI